jgi:ACDE family multidrug resistance protein
LAIPLLALSISSFISGKKIGESKNLMKIVIVVGMGLVTVSIIALRIQHSFFYLISFLVITGIGIGISLPSLDAIITQRIEKDQRGTMTSFYSSMRFIGVAAGPPAYSYFMTVSDHLIYYISGGASLLAAIVVIVFIKSKDRHQKGVEKWRIPKLV